MLEKLDAFIDKAGDNKLYLWLFIMGGAAVVMPIIVAFNKLLNFVFNLLLPDPDKDDAVLAAMRREETAKNGSNPDGDSGR